MTEVHKIGSVAVGHAHWGRSEPEESQRSLVPMEGGRTPAGEAAEAEMEDRRQIPVGDLEPLEHYKADDPEALARAVERMEQFMQRVGRDLEFRVDDATGKTVVTVYVRGTDDVVRQIPPEEMLAIAERMREVQGLLFNGQA